MAKHLPIELTAFEKYMVRASWPGDPMLCECNWEFSGTLHRESFEAAMRHAVELNPLFRCRVDWPASGEPRWVPADFGDVPIHWMALTPPERWNDDFDLGSERGIRAWVSPLDPQRSRVSIRFHHAISDGVGIARLWGDLLICYDGLRSPGGVPAFAWPPADPALLELRGDLEPSRPWLTRIRSGIELARLGTKVPPMPLAAPSRAPEPWTDGRLAYRVLRGSVFEQLRALASGRGVSFNDYLLATLFRTLVIWNERHGDPKPTDRLRVMMPTNARDARHLLMPAANCVGFAVIDRLTADVADPKLVETIGRDTREARKRYMGSAFVDIMAFKEAIARIRGQAKLRKRKRRSKRCEATATLSYMGNGERFIPQGGRRDEHGHYVFGDITLLRSVGITPRQDMMRIALTASYYLDQFSVCVNADPSVLDYAQALEFADIFTSLLKADAGVDEPDFAEPLAAPENAAPSAT